MSGIQKLEFNKMRYVCIVLAVDLRLSTTWKYSVIHAISHLDLNLNYNIFTLVGLAYHLLERKAFFVHFIQSKF